METPEHYKGKMQPVEFIVKSRWSFIQGNVLKYVMRYQKKDGIKDLEKAIHYCELGIQLHDTRVGFSLDYINQFIEANDFVNPEWMSTLMEEISFARWHVVKMLIEPLKEYCHVERPDN